MSKELADARHYPSVAWTDSFSGYVATAAQWWADNVDPRWAEERNEALGLLAQADELARIVNLVGPEALSPSQRWVLEGAGLLKEGVLQQSALDEVDSYASPQKQFLLLDLILQIYREGQALLAEGVPVQQLQLPVLGRARRIKGAYDSTQIEGLRSFAKEIREEFRRLRIEYGETEKRSS